MTIRLQRCRSVWVLLALLVPAGPLQAQMEKRPLVAEDWYRFRNLSGIQASPDGRSAVISIGTVDTASDAYTSDLWRLDLESGALSRLTHHPDGEWSPRYSPDGQTLAFLAARDDRTRVFGLPMQGGEPEPLFDFAGDVEEFAFFPDGRRVVFVARDPALAPGEQRRPEVLTYTRTWFKVNGEGFVDSRPAQLWVADLGDGSVTRLTGSEFDHTSPAVSPDGRWVAFVSNRTADPDLNRNTNIWIVPADGGGRVWQVSAAAGMAAEPRWSPDGRSLAWLEQSVANNYGAHFYVWVASVGFGAEVGTPRNLTGGLDLSVGEGSYHEGGAPYPVWSRDGRLLYLAFEARGRLHGYTLDVRTGQARLLLGGDRMVEFLTPTGDGTRLVFGVSSDTSLSDVYLSGPDGRAPRRLTALNPWFDSVRTGPVESFRYRSGDGEQIEGFVVQPAGFPGRPVPAVLAIHGGPQWYYSAGYDFFMQLIAARGYLAVYVNPRGSTTYGTRFLDLVGDRYGHSDYQDFMAAVDTMVARGWAHPDSLFVTGNSYGGMATSWIVTRTTRFRAAASASGVSDYTASFGMDDDPIEWIAAMGGAPWEVPDKYRAYSPMTFITRVRTPTLFLHGADDWICPTAESERMYLALRLLGVPTRLVIFPGENHNFDARASSYPARLSLTLDWFDEFRNASQ